ncbi:STAS domain-containing protein [Actinoplanes sp. NPDC049596]|uniref:STAS domain-containing protein n=1 Tax=unclassified Actinoplanes TaxID=2626549 RepID=UPI00343DBDBB
MADSYKIGQERSADGTATVLSIDGELDINARDDLRAAILGAVDRGDCVVDLGGTAFLDSEALGALIDGYNSALSAGTGFRVVGATGVVARVLDVSGAAALFGS